MQAPGLRPWVTTTGTGYSASGNAIIPLSVPLPSGTAQITPTPGTSPAGTGSEFDANWRSIFGNNNYLTPTVMNAQALGAVDLNRKLTDYRGNPALAFDAIVSPTAPYAAIPAGGTGGVPNGSINYAQALADRQALASDIFNRLLAATGLKVPGQTFGGNPFPTPTSTGTSSPYCCFRFLAQIAVNIVDYIDNDDYITPFNWNPAYSTTTNGLTFPENTNGVISATQFEYGWVFGTELPRLVINETLQVIDNDYVNGVAPTPPTAASKVTPTGNYLCGLWIELFNPLTPPGNTDSNLSHQGGAPLVYPPPGTNTTSQTTQPVYQLVIASEFSSNLSNMSTPDGHHEAPLGNPGFTAGATTASSFIVSPLTSTTTSNPALQNGAIKPSNAQQGLPLPTTLSPVGGNPGFYVIGPPNAYNLYYNSPAGGNLDQPATIPGTTTNPATDPGLPVSYSPPVGTNPNGFSPLMWPLANTVNFATLGQMGNSNVRPPIPANFCIADQVLLQRLIHPHLPPNPPSGTTTLNTAMQYNPYVTVDYCTPGTGNIGNTTTSFYTLDHRYLTTTGVNAKQFSFSNQCSFGRDQPYNGYAASLGQNFDPSSSTAQNGVFPDATALNHSFYQQNKSPLEKLPNYTWVPHMDRPLVSLPELFWVSAWPPYYFTYLCCQHSSRNFVNGQYFPIGHTVPWFVNDSSTTTASTAAFTYSMGNVNPLLLYRALGLLDIRSKMQGIGFGGGRVPGKVNINTIWDPPSSTNLAGASVASPTLNAMLDPPMPGNSSPSSTANLFTQQHAINAWWGLCNNSGSNSGRPCIMNLPFTPQTQTSSNIYSAWTAGVQGPPYGLYDTPLQPPSAGFTSITTDTQNQPNPGAGLPRGVQNTILGLGAYSPTGTLGTGMFMNTTETHPYLQMEMLSKFFNNYTTRSNTFAVYCTVGYFEVTNSGPFGPSNRPALGKEIGSDDGTNVRHKFFAVVDRTNLAIDQTTLGTSRQLQGPQPVYLSYEPTTADIRLPDPATSSVASASIRIPATGSTSSNGTLTGLTGVYDGQLWTLQVGAKILLDVGDRQEIAYVQSLTAPANTAGALSAAAPGVGADITIGPTFPAVAGQNFKFNHYRGANMQMNYAATLPGNPGPQPQFNFRDPRYLPVVPVVYRYN